MTGRSPAFHSGAALLIPVCALLIAITLPGCSDTVTPFRDTIPLTGCRAFDCHQSTPLSIYPPVSGEHLTHTGLSQYGPDLSCGSCHSGYYTSILHRNGFINGYNWLIGKRTSGLVVYFGARMSASSSFDQAAGTCSGTGTECHGSGPSDSWYEGAGGTCGNSSSCHLAAPLSQYPPATGAHAVHRYKNTNCTSCHYNYFRNALHRDTFVEGSTLDPKATVENSVVLFNPAKSPSGSWNNTTGDCSSIGCHGGRNWYKYTSTGECPVCHAYPPLSRSRPATGRHGTHLGEGGISCLTCHKDYAGTYVKNVSLHNNGAINGSSLDPKATVFGDIVNFSGSGTYDTSTGDCSSIGCHGSENWWSGGD